MCASRFSLFLTLAMRCVIIFSLEKASFLQLEVFSPAMPWTLVHIWKEKLCNRRFLQHMQRSVSGKYHVLTASLFLAREGSTLQDTQSQLFKVGDYHFKVESVFNNSLNYREHCPTYWYLSVSGDHGNYLWADLCTFTHVFSFS